jgi:hypothetical protein
MKRKRTKIRFTLTRAALPTAFLIMSASASHTQTIPCSQERDADCRHPYEESTTSLPDVGSRPPWTLLSRNDDADTGYVMDKRELTGSNSSVFRLTAVLNSPPELVARVAIANLVDPENRQKNTEKTILRNDDDVIIVYSYIHINTPFVSDRDVISRIERSYDPETRTHQIRWKAIEEGPPKKDGVIRLNRSEGSWTFSPDKEGKTQAVYVSHTEVAGYVPAWIVNSTMDSTMLNGIERLREAVDLERMKE